MSRIGKQPVEVPAEVAVTLQGREIKVKGPKGELTWCWPDTAEVKFDDGARQVTVACKGESHQARANFGLTRSLIANMVEGVSKGFERRLEIYGTGYNCKLDGRTLHLNVGFVGRRRGLGSQFELPVPEGVEVVVEVPAARGDSEPARLVVRGYDKQAVGQFAAEIHSLRRTEPYKGKGIRYAGEYIKRKQGKALSGSG